MLSVGKVSFMTASERYSRHEAVPGWNQATLAKKSAVVIGSDRLADFILVDLISLGCSSVRRLGVNNFLPYDALNPDVTVEQHPGSLQSLPHAEYFCDGADVVIEATHHAPSKQFAAKAAAKKGIPLVSACAGRSSFSVYFMEHPCKTEHPEINAPSGQIYGILAAACAVDEIRKWWMPRADEKPKGMTKFFDIEEPYGIEKKILQIGAGAIGTTTALALAMMHAEIMLVDFDRVEESNLTRQ